MRPNYFKKRRINILPIPDGQFLLLYFNGLAWLLLICTSIFMSPRVAHAAKQETVRKGASNAKATAPVRSISKVRARSALLQQPTPTTIDPSEKRQHLVYRSRPGDKLPNLLNRYALAPGEKQYWFRALKRDFGMQTLPAGKEVHFYFTKPTVRGRVQKTARQLKALEVDYNDSSTLTWERAIRGILFQQREKPYDVELKTATAVVHESLFEDGRKAGIHSALLSQLVDIFTWDIGLRMNKVPYIVYF